MTDEKEVPPIKLRVTSGSVSSRATGHEYCIRMVLEAESDSSDALELIRSKLDGFEIYDCENFLQMALDVANEDIEKEQQKIADLEREHGKRVAELEAEIAHQKWRAQVAMEENQRLVPENIRLRAIEATLESIAGLKLAGGGKIG